MSTNIVILTGNLGNDVILKEFENGGKVANFSIATNYFYKDREGNSHKKTDWHNIVVNGKVAENCTKYLKKGSKVLVSGSLRNRIYEKDGQTFRITEVLASKVEFLDSKDTTEEE